MRFETKYIPKDIIIEKKNKAGRWIEVDRVSTEKSMSAADLVGLCEQRVVSYDRPVRFLDAKTHNQIINSSLIWYCHEHSIYNLMDRSNLIIESKKEDGKYRIVSIHGKNNPMWSPIALLYKSFAVHGGFRSWRVFPVEQRDGYLVCGELTFMDGHKTTLGFYR